MYGKSTKPTAAVSKAKIKKNDEVLVISGKDRGKKGKVLRVLPSKGAAIVERVNFSKKHQRPNPQKNVKGGILEREAPIRLSNLMVICPACSEPARLGRKNTDLGTVRFCRKCNTELAG
jgi:large subunit ribosomal protein L24